MNTVQPHRESIINQAAGGWELAGVLMFQTGPFLTVLASGADPSGTNFCEPHRKWGARYRIGNQCEFQPRDRSANGFNPASFAIPANNIGPVRRFAGGICGGTRDAGGHSHSLYFQYLERAKLRVGMAASNAFNHPNYGTPGLTLGHFDIWA